MIHISDLPPAAGILLAICLLAGGMIYLIRTGEQLARHKEGETFEEAFGVPPLDDLSDPMPVSIRKWRVHERLRQQVLLANQGEATPGELDDLIDLAVSGGLRPEAVYPYRQDIDDQ